MLLPSHDRDFYRSSEWAELSKRCKERDQYTCRRCGWRATTKFERYLVQAHHILARRRGGRDVLSNLITICEPCHEREPGHQHMRYAREAKTAKRNQIPKPFRAKRYSI